MPGTTGPVYEVTHRVDPEIIDDFDAWLSAHIEEMLELPGIARASVFIADDDEHGRPRRVTHYLFDGDNELDEYLAGPAVTMRQAAEQLFGDQFEVARRVLRETEYVDGEVRPTEACLNCGTTLSGQYCGHCGQRARSRLISIWELMQEAFGDLFELDSRLWRTLIPLVVRPGRLTRDYLEGRRARFMPPFRTYLVLSIFFFLIAFFDPREELGLLFEPEETPTEEATEAGQDANEIRQEVLDELVEEGVISAEQAESGQLAGEDGGVVIDPGGDQPLSTTEECQDMDVGEMPDWMASRLTPDRLQVVCERVMADDGKAFIGKLLDNVPAALFILLPLMAMILKILYPLSKRYYVEHLLFVIHFHAFVFLILTLQILFGRLGSIVSLPEAVSGVTIFAVSLYIPVYFYKAMRRVYEQGHVLSSLKFIVLLMSYFFGLSFILLFAALFAAFSI
jgi:hypothetical protein